MYRILYYILIATPTEQSDTNWDLVEQTLRDHGVNGKHLPHLGGNIISFAGIKDSTKSAAMVSSIDGLVKAHSSAFEKFWSQFERKWKEWTSDDLTEWLKYSVMLLDTGDIDWKMANKLLATQNMNGAMLPKINEAMLPFIGIAQKDIIDCIVSSIRTLLSRYDSKTELEESGSVDIPAEFLCPISKELMKDPVIAFDGNTYERSEIEDYLKQNNKSPLTGADAQHSFVFPNNDMKKRIEAFLSANNHNMQESVEMAAEGVVETGYI